MRGIVFIVLLQFTWTLGLSQDSNHHGAGSFAYVDSSGHQYTGSYKLKNGRPVQTSGDFPVPFSETTFPGYDNGFDYGFQAANFYPTYFVNLENLLQEVFQSNLENQKLAYNAAKKAFDLSSNQAGYYPNFVTRLPQSPFNNFGDYQYRYGGGYPFPSYPSFDMSNFGNSAFASAAAGPGYRSQIAAINPPNPNFPNINKVSYSSDNPTRGGYYSVASNAYSSSSNVNGREHNHRGSSTIVDDNGKVTKYSVGN